MIRLMMLLQHKGRDDPNDLKGVLRRWYAAVWSGFGNRLGLSPKLELKIFHLCLENGYSSLVLSNSLSVLTDLFVLADKITVKSINDMDLLKLTDFYLFEAPICKVLKNFEEVISGRRQPRVSLSI